MRFSANNKYKDGAISSYRLVLGCDQAKALGFVDEQGNGMQIIPVRTQNGVLLIPAANPVNMLEYNGLTTTVYKYGSVFCGEIADGRKYSSWYTLTENKIESCFHSAADKLIAT